MIPGIFIAALVTSLFTLGLIGGILFASAPRPERRGLALVLVVHLPMCALAYYGVRLPIRHLIEQHVDATAPAYVLSSVLYAPLTEEPAKLWLLLFPWFRRLLTPRTAVRLGMAIGLGFGVGELWFLAELISRNPAFAAEPWYHFGGFLNERFMVCICHGVFTTTALRLFATAPLRGFLSAAGLHFIGNFPIALAALRVGGLDADTWKMILVIWVQVFFVAMVALLLWYVKASLGLTFAQLMRRLAGRARCPGCGLEFDRLGRFALVNGGALLPRWNFDAVRDAASFTGPKRCRRRPKVLQSGIPLERSEKRGQAPLPERPKGCCAQRCLTPFFRTLLAVDEKIWAGMASRNRGGAGSSLEIRSRLGWGDYSERSPFPPNRRMRSSIRSPSCRANAARDSATMLRSTGGNSFADHGQFSTTVVCSCCNSSIASFKRLKLVTSNSRS